MPEATVTQEIEKGLKSINDQVTNAVNKVNEEVQAHGKVGVKNQEALAKLTGNIEEITARVLEVEQQGTRQQDVENAIKSVGAQFTDSDVFNSYKSGNTTKASLDIKNNIQTGSDVTVAPDRKDNVVGGAFRKLRVLDVLQKGTTTSNAIEYTRENVYTNGAAEKAEGNTAYGETSITFELKTATVRNIGTHIPISKQMLEDAPLVASYINGRLIYGVQFRKDLQALAGNGTGQNISGINVAGNHVALAGTSAGDGHFKNVRRAIAQVDLADYMANAIILNPEDCANIDLETGSDDHFISGNPRLQQVKSLWGLPVIETNAMAKGKFLLGAFDMACQWTERRGVMLEMSDSHDDNFTKDMVTLKATARAALEIYRPASLVGGDLVIPAAP